MGRCAIVIRRNRQFEIVFLTERESYHHELRAAMSYRLSPLVREGSNTIPGSEVICWVRRVRDRLCFHLILGMTAFTIKSVAQIPSKKRTGCHGSAAFFGVAFVVTSLV